MLLNYFATSRARRELLRVLWGEKTEGSVSELARRAQVSFAATHRELDAMRAAGLAACERRGSRLVYHADRSHPQAALVARLVRNATAPRSAAPSTRHDERVRGWLAAAGAPLLVKRPAPARQPGIEDVVAEGLALAHRDATVARVLPLVLWQQRARLDLPQLVVSATRLDERQALGFFLELTGRLGGDPRLAAAARRLRDKRRSRVRPFFAKPQGRFALAATRRNTPRLAREWGYLMNVGLDSFASAFSKHALA